MNRRRIVYFLINFSIKICFSFHSKLLIMERFCGFGIFLHNQRAFVVAACDGKDVKDVEWDGVYLSNTDDGFESVWYYLVL